jgi:lycopene cyclase domain-containing protein
MTTYLVLNLVFLVVVVGGLLMWPSLVRFSKSFWLTLLILLVCTAIFDSLIISAGIVEYNPDKLLGIFIGSAPIEDFFYAVLACIIVPTVWIKLGERGSHERKA